MGRVTLELSDETLEKAATLAAGKGMPLAVFLAHQVDELVKANDRYERARASVATMFPDAGQENDTQRFFERWRSRPGGRG